MSLIGWIWVPVNQLTLVIIVQRVAIRVQILNKAICISHCTNTLRNDMNPTLFSQAMGE